MDHVFGTTSFRGELAAAVQGMPDAASTTQWLIDDRERFQLEVFEFEHPHPKLLQQNSSITDIGYNRLIFAVRTVAEVRQAANEFGCSVDLMTDSPDINRVHARLVDPDGILVELIEWPEKVSGSRSAQLIGLGLTTADLDTSVEDMCEGFGFQMCSDVFEHSGCWSEQGRLQKHQTLQMGDMYVVASQYRDSRPRPSDHQLADIGIMNFAIFLRDQADFAACMNATQRLGMRPNCAPLSVGNEASIVYNNDRQGFSVEMIFLAPKLWGLYGFKHPSLADRVLNWLAERKAHFLYGRGAPGTSNGNINPFSYKVATSIDIQACTEQVWRELENFRDYDAWNPMLRNVSIELTPGSPVRFEVRQAGKRALKLSARITQLDFQKKLAWKGGIPLLATGEHYFMLEKLDESSCRFSHGEQFRGLLLPLLGRALKRATPLYRAMNQALKRRVEKLATGSVAANTATETRAQE